MLIDLNHFFFTGVDRSPVIEGAVSYLEIPRTQTSLGIAIVGGSDTPLVSKRVIIDLIYIY